MSVQIFVNFDGNCREAVEFYATVFGLEPPKYMTFSDNPDQSQPLPEHAKDRIMYTDLRIEGDLVMFSDTWPGMEFIVGNNLSLTVVTPDMAKARSYFEKMSTRGKIDMDLQETFWSPLYGSIKDDFGVYWQFSTEPPKTE